MPGGQFKAPTLSLSGDKAAEYFQDVLAGKLFLATAGVALDSGLTYPSFADLQLKQAMIRAAAHVYLVADSTKINRSSFTRLGDARRHSVLHHRRRHSRRGRSRLREPRDQDDYRGLRRALFDRLIPYLGPAENETNRKQTQSILALSSRGLATPGFVAGADFSAKTAGCNSSK